MLKMLKRANTKVKINKACMQLTIYTNRQSEEYKQLRKN